MPNLHEVTVEIKLDEKAQRANESIERLGKAMGGAIAPVSRIGENLTELAFPISVMNSVALIAAEREQEEARRRLVHELFIAYLDWPSPCRREWESLLEWGKRLAESGELDDPDIRWMYQKTVLKAVFMPWRKS